MNRIRRLALVLVVAAFVLSPVDARADSGRARIALYEPAGQKEDATLAAVLSTVADSVELSLDVLQRYDVKRLPPVDPSRDLDKVRSYCETNRIDQAILGSGAVRAAGGYDFRLDVYDRRKDAITVDKQASSSGTLDMFDTTDALVASLLDGLSGTHLQFGSLSVETDPSGAAVSVNGRDVGQSPVNLRGLPVGTVQVSAHSEGREDTAASVTIIDGQSTEQKLTLARSVGTLFVQEPSDAVVAVRNAEIGEKRFTGIVSVSLPTGDYDVAATDAGLPTIAGRLTISRNQASPWQPWTKAYLAIQAAAGVDVLVDGQDRGSAPQVVEVEPGTLHRLELKRDHYKTYVADLGAAAGDKTVFAPEPTANPGSIKIVTSIPGVDADLDGKQKAITPAVFDNVAAGTHVVHLGSLGWLKRVYMGGDPFPVEVKPDEQTQVSRTMAEGNGHLTITDAPGGSSLEIDGQPIDSAQAFTTGIAAPAGELDLAINGLGGEKWTQTVNLDVGGDVKESIYSMAWHIQRRTVRMDGNPEDWKGLMPVWVPEPQTGIPDQPGTDLVRGFACRDDSYLYFRFEFANGTPRTDLAKGIALELDYVATVYTRSGPIQATTRFRRNQVGGATSLSLYDPRSQSTRSLGENAFKSQIGESSLEIALPFRLIKSYIASGVTRLALNVADVGSYGWLASVQTGPRQVEFDF